MLKEQFLGRNPSHFHFNSIVKAFIISEMLIWSAWNFITPIFAVFASTKITGGSVAIAASSYSAHLISRVITEFFSGMRLERASEKNKLIISIIGICFITVSYLGFAIAQYPILLYVLYAVSGAGIGLATPAKNSLFATHLDKNKTTSEWGIYDAAVFICTAVAATSGGLIAESYGFHILFIISAVLNTAGIIPYIIQLQYIRKKTVS